MTTSYRRFSSKLKVVSQSQRLHTRQQNDQQIDWAVLLVRIQHLDLRHLNDEDRARNLFQVAFDKQHADQHSVMLLEVFPLHVHVQFHRTSFWGDWVTVIATCPLIVTLVPPPNQWIRAFEKAMRIFKFNECVCNYKAVYVKIRPNRRNFSSLLLL